MVFKYKLTGMYLKIMYAMAVRMLPASEIERLTYVPALNDILLTP
jgi:hypothetical protein